jgi:hypothetical protein
MSAERRREFHEALLDADNFEDLPGKWQEAILSAERAGLLGGILASPTCGGIESAERLEALAQVVRSQGGENGGGQPQQQPAAQT